ncbi:MAG: imidazole glycerol phosphate synthase subunit HisH, partial [Rhodospirillales bacterium]|nr:imidazole glycerol phosphate synthase subunit HisH [Rhodospirillales bacterium]
MSRIALVGYGMGNVQSVLNALEHVGANAFVADTPEDLNNADRILLPGVGAFGEASERLSSTGFRTALDDQVKGKGKPLLGICLGMQMLASRGTEHGDWKGLGYIPGTVEVIPRTSPDLRLPHVGWNALDITADCPLLAGVKSGDDCYFVHSYHFMPEDSSAVAATCDYGSRVTAAIWRGNI